MYATWWLPQHWGENWQKSLNNEESIRRKTHKKQRECYQMYYFIIAKARENDGEREKFQAGLIFFVFAPVLNLHSHWCVMRLKNNERRHKTIIG